MIIAVRECGYGFEYGKTQPDDFDIDVYYQRNMRDLAEEFVAEGLMGDIPDHLQFYIYDDAIARDLAIDYSETSISGASMIYCCG